MMKSLPLLLALLASTADARIMDGDQREVVSPLVYPYTAIGQIRARWGKSSFTGTGVLISDSTVLTAAHCLYRQELGGWAEEATFAPARSGNSTPYGIATIIQFTASPSLSVGSETDIAIVTLDKPIGTQAGWLRVCETECTNATIVSAGYPADNGYLLMYTVGTLYQTHDTNIDATFGQSGSPLWIVDQDGAPTIVAILVSELPSTNLAAPVTTSMLAHLTDEPVVTPDSCGTGIVPLVPLSVIPVFALRRRYNLA